MQVEFRTPITSENHIVLSTHDVSVRVLEEILTALRKHGSVFVEISIHGNTAHNQVPTLAEVLFNGGTR